MAEGVGFEPTIRFPVRLISSQVPSTNSATLPFGSASNGVIVPWFFGVLQVVCLFSHSSCAQDLSHEGAEVRKFYGWLLLNGELRGGHLWGLRQSGEMLNNLLKRVSRWGITGLFLSLGGIVGIASDAEMVFPEVEGKSLQGEVVQFPDVFSKKPFHIAVIAFEQKQQPEVDTWLPSLKGLLEEREDVDYFELPTIKPMNSVMRWIIYRGMRSGIKDEGDRTRTVTLHIDKEPFKTALKIDSEASIVVVVVDAKGKVVGRSEGAFGEEKWEKLVSVLDGR